MTPIHALIFEKYIKMCVYIRLIKKPVYIDYTLQKYNINQQEKLAGRSFFSKLGLTGSGHVSPGGSSRAAPLSLFSCCFEAQWALLSS